MNVDFINELAMSQATIPSGVSRIAGFFLVLQGVFIFFQKKNNPNKDIWEDISGVLLAGLVVYLFPELIKLAELSVNAFCQIEVAPGSAIAEFLRESNMGDGTVVAADAEADASESSGFFTALLGTILSNVTGSNPASFLIAKLILKPLADFVNILCFPTYWIVRAVSLKIVYWIAPLVLALGALPPFRSLWKHWFMIYFALLVSGPALVLANDFCEECFSIYINATNSPVIGFIIIALARYKALQAVVDLCYRIFRV